MKIKIFIKVFLIILGIFILPIIINYVLIIPTPFDLNIIGDEIDWLSFWGTYLGGVIGAFVSFLILYFTLLHNKKEAEIERANNILLQLKKDLSERLSDVNYMPLYINTYNDINISVEIERLNVLQGVYQQKMLTAKFMYENDKNEFAKQFYDAYYKFILVYCGNITTIRKILTDGDNKDDMLRRINETINSFSMFQLKSFEIVNDAALKYYQSEKEKLELLKISFL